jgi:hypothetical protein
MQVERSSSLSTRRLLAVVSGEAQFTTLSPDERVAAHALIDAEIGGRVSEQRFGAAATSAGHTTVSLDSDGNLIEISADGTRRLL